MTRYCVDCNAEVLVRPDDHTETYHILGEPVTLVARRLVGVPCGHPIADAASDTHTLREARDLYMQRHHLSLAEFRMRQLAYRPDGSWRP